MPSPGNFHGNKIVIRHINLSVLHNKMAYYMDSPLAAALRNCIMLLLCVTGTRILAQSGITPDDSCFSKPIQFSSDTAGVDALLWNFGDPASGAQNTSTAFFPLHQFTDTGSFVVTVIVQRDNMSDTLERTMFIYPDPTLDLGANVALCEGQSVSYSITQPYASFLWHDGSTAASMTVQGDELVTVWVFGICDTLSDSVQVTFDDPISFDLGPDTVLCDSAGTFVIDANLQVSASVLWNTSDTGDAIAVSQSGIYSMTAINACNAMSDSVQVVFKPVPAGPLLPEDTVYCYDDPLVISRPQVAGLTYVWSDSSGSQTYTADTTETVWLAAYNECGIAVDSMHVLYIGEIKSELGNDTMICDRDSIVLRATWPGASYLWSTGDTTDTLVTLEQDMSYAVTVSKAGCEKTSSIRVEPNELACRTIDCHLEYANVFTPNGDGHNDIFRAWSDCDIHSFDLSIYNRWGQLVHYSRNAMFGWDGSINGEMAPPGIYYFRISFNDMVVVDVDRTANQGSITLVR